MNSSSNRSSPTGSISLQTEPQLLAGNNLILRNVGQLHNDYGSLLAGGDMTIGNADPGGSYQTSSVNNTSAVLNQTTVIDEYSIFRWNRNYGAANTVSLAPQANTQVTQRIGGTLSAGGTLAIYAASISNTNALPGQSNASGAFSGAASPGPAAASVSPPTLSALAAAGGAVNTGSSLRLISPPAPGQNYLIASDPRFTNYSTWLSSDYLLSALGIQPDQINKRLGDGFYEQRLINEQVGQLTGRRFLGNYSSNEAQYQALMDSGITYAKAFNLRPGIALSAEQMAALTSDMVWLVEQTVALPDGTTTKALVPQVYIASVRPSDLSPSGALLTGQSININLSGDLSNSGTISGSVAGRTLVSLNAQNVSNLGGRITGETVNVNARNDINTIGGQIDAANSLSLQAGRDINSASTRTGAETSGNTTRIGNTTSSFSGIDRVAALYVSNPGGSLLASAGRDVNLIASTVQSQGSARVQAGGNITLGTVQQSDTVDASRDARNYVRIKQSQDVGSSVSSNGNLSLQAGNNINTTAASVSSQGALSLNAGNSVTINAGQSSSAVATASFAEGSGFLSSASTELRSSASQTKALGSSLGGNTISITAGQDIQVKGSSVIGDQATTLSAGQNIAITADQNTRTSSSFTERKESGLLDGPSLGITIGTREQSADQQNQSTTAAASTVGAIKGNVTATAGKEYRQVGSDVMAPGGNVSIQAQTVTIQEARETSQSATEQKFQQSGISVGISNPLISAAQTAQSMAQAAGNTSDPRMQALAAAAAGLTAKNAYDAVSADPKALGGLNISITLGSSTSQSLQQSSSDTARGSTVTAGGAVDIAARGGGAASDVRIQGSTVQAGDSVNLSADHNINLSAAANTSQQSRSSSANSAGVGVAISMGSNGTGAGFTANASAARGSGNGQDTRWTNTQITGGQAVNLQSGADTTLKGAVVSANTVQADVGGNLNIQSLQDSSSYNSKDQSVGGSVTVGAGFAGSLNIGQQRINSNFASVTAQSGIQAGDGGFQVSVGNNTDLKGGVVASTDKAVNDNKNTFSTGTLTTSDIQNTAQYSASSFAIGGGYSDGKGLLPIGGGASSAGAGSATGLGTDSKGNAQSGAAQTPGSTLPGYNGFSATVPLALSASGNASSTTASGISAAAIRITDSAGQQALSGKTAEQTLATLDSSVRSGVDSSHALQPIFNESDIRARFEIVGILSRETGTFLANRAQESTQIKAELAQETAKPPEQQDPVKLNQLSQSLADRQTWEMGGTGRILLTAVTSAAGANVMGSTTAMVQGAAANYLQSLATEQVKFIGDTLSSEPARAALQGIVACGGAALQSQNCGAAAAGAASSVVLNNLLDGLTGSQASTLTPDQKQARENIITSLIAGTATLVGGQAAIATIAARIETENNAANFVRGTTERIRTVANSAADVLRKPRGTLTRADIDAQLSKLNAVGAQGNLSVQESLNLSSLWMAVIERAAVEGLMSPSEIVGSKQFMQAAIASMAFSGGGNGPLSQNSSTSSTGPVLPRTSSPFVAQGGGKGVTTSTQIDLAPPPNTYRVYTRGAGAAEGPLPPGYTTVSRWVSPEEASLWVQNQGTAIPAAVPRNGTPQVYVSEAGAPRAPGANGTVRIDFAVPNSMLQTGNASNNSMILQPSSSTPIYNVNIHVPNGVTLPKAR